ncbi:MAG: AbrB family transcriptional regulator, partial [Desulfotomaculaceae bacterium]|nr:AbrB family transcriptional regulator [Desulfotomaculaceae bacterium]
MKKFYVAKITDKGQVTVPLEIRKALNVEEG